jgi:hypothetical protein
LKIFDIVKKLCYGEQTILQNTFQRKIIEVGWCGIKGNESEKKKIEILMQ